CVFATPAALDAALPGQTAAFDVVLVTGAGQLTVDEALPAVERGRQFVLVGEEPAGVEGPERGLSILEAALEAGVSRGAQSHVETPPGDKSATPAKAVPPEANPATSRAAKRASH